MSDDYLETKLSNKKYKGIWWLEKQPMSWKDLLDLVCKKDYGFTIKGTLVNNSEIIYYLTDEEDSASYKLDSDMLAYLKKNAPSYIIKQIFLIDQRASELIK